MMICMRFPVLSCLQSLLSSIFLVLHQFQLSISLPNVLELPLTQNGVKKLCRCSEEYESVTRRIIGDSFCSLLPKSGRPRFVNLRQVIYFLFSLPFSNVVAERLFSTLKEVKTDKQNKLSTLTLSAIVLNAGRRG